MSTTVFRKSWPQFLRPILALVISIGIAYLTASRFDVLLDWTGDFLFDLLSSPESNRAEVQELSSTISFWLYAAVIALASIWALRTVFRLIWLSTFKIEVGPAHAAASYGVLPWNKWARTWETDQIYECLYRQSGFLNWLVRHGTLVITGREGSTKEFSFDGIGRVQKACSMINAIRHRPK